MKSMRPVLFLVVLSLLASLLAGCGDLGPAKDFAVIPLDDQAKSISLKDFKGKLVLLDFWATYCQPCRQAMPEVQSVWEKYRSRGLEVMAISDEPRSVLLAFHRGSQLSYPVYVDSQGDASLTYGVTQIPRFVLIKNGRIIWDQLSYSPGEIEQHVADAIG